MLKTLPGVIAHGGYVSLTAKSHKDEIRSETLTQCPISHGEGLTGHRISIQARGLNYGDPDRPATDYNESMGILPRSRPCHFPVDHTLLNTLGTSHSPFSYLVNLSYTPFRIPSC